jgi:glycosidase
MKLASLFLALASVLFCPLSSDAQFSNMDSPKVSTNLQIFQKAPAWTAHATIYEVNLRQYSASGSFRDFEKELPRLKSMGVDILWFMPIHPIGLKERKGSLGSYYAVQDYLAVNPEHGSMDDFKHLVETIHGMGMHVMIDWVANHTAADSKWSVEHPEFFTKDASGKFVPPVADWSDVIDLDYENKNMRSAMIDAMKFWVEKTGIDGFRCDVAEMVPTSFWVEAFRELKKIKPDIFMLAEGEKAELHLGFHMTYTWSLFHLLTEIAGGKKNAKEIDAYVARMQKEYTPLACRMNFTSNHDENSWNGTEYERMGDGAKAFAVLTAFLPGMPLVYSGQESALNHRLKFFDKDVIDWKDYPLNDFYTRLLQLKQHHPAMAGCDLSVPFERLDNSAPESIFSYRRKRGEDEVIVLINLSASPKSFSLNASLANTDYTELFSEKKYTANDLKNLELKPWDYLVLKIK